MTDYTLGNDETKTSIVFHCRFRNPATEGFVKLIIAAIPNAGAEDLLFAYMITNTTGITFNYNPDPDGVKSDIMVALESYWLWCLTTFFRMDGDKIVGIVDDEETMRLARLKFDDLVFDKLQEHWAMAYKNAQVIFPATQLIRPDELLDKELLKSPDFLATAPRT